MPNHRLFIAVDLPAEVRKVLADQQQQLKQAKAVRWTRPEQIHLTLQFLGDVPVEAVDAIPRALQSAVSVLPAFQFNLTGVGVFPNFKAPRIVWAGITEGAEQVALLYRAVITATRPLGFTPESRPFTPHLTIGRVQTWARLDDYAQISAAIRNCPAHAAATVTVDHVTLFRSELKPSGPIYTPLAKIGLNGKNDQPSAINR